MTSTLDQTREQQEAEAAELSRSLPSPLPAEVMTTGIECPACGRSFKSLQGMKTHQSRKHKTKATKRRRRAVAAPVVPLNLDAVLKQVYPQGVPATEADIHAAVVLTDQVKAAHKRAAKKR